MGPRQHRPGHLRRHARDGRDADADIDARQALAVTTGHARRPSWPIIDDGVDFSHPDLAARAWTNPGESGDGKETNGVDDDDNGYIDDVHGWDFCHDDNTVHDFDDDFHGTHVAGILAASLDGIGVVGVAPGVSIMALKFLGDDDDCGFDSMAIAAIEYAKSFGVRIANASWGGVGDPADAPDLYDAIRDSGMLFVAAAGNNGGDNDQGPWTTLPASFDLPNIVSVAAVDNYGGLGLVLELRPADGRHRRSRRGDPEHAAGRDRASDAGLGLARRDVDGGAARLGRRGARGFDLAGAGAMTRPGSRHASWAAASRHRGPWA